MSTEFYRQYRRLFDSLGEAIAFENRVILYGYGHPEFIRREQEEMIKGPRYWEYLIEKYEEDENNG